MQNIAKPNEPLVTHIYTADPSAHVFEGKIYIYPSHDLNEERDSNDDGDQYNMKDYHVLSMDDFNSPCVDNGEVLNLRDIPWASEQLWAPDAAYKNNMYYFYFPARDKEGIFRIGVATSTTPSGPFKPEENYIPGSYSIDPAVLVDDDDKTYIYFGGLWGGQLEKWQTGAFNADGIGPDESAPAIGPRVAELSDDMLTFKETPEEIVIVDEEGNSLLAGDEERRYFEGPWVHKHNEYYYLSYSTGSTHYIVYAMSKNPKGPYVFKGRILNPVIGWTTHHSIVKHEEKWYLFYHDSSLSGGADNKRSVKYTELKYNDDGTIQTIKYEV
ncbi:glycoside hydrolase family 43 protein [Clostridium grantii]|uniref:Glycosyl hydrolases family 43 n=1 Tax=Clostridium grantii DSM 8605 TaxID=1121316 RepID=A0A1M5WLK9_9CLOT|nr:glycoside hydrolase family 43 protein [Clostridium grantii]SHH88490.1 Glycosyl hydrolases family 43 [Clostridium grantii DSM 8605]